MKYTVALTLLTAIAFFSMAFSRKSHGQEDARRIIDDHVISIGIYRTGLSGIIEYISSKPQIFARQSEKNYLPDRETKEIIWQTWQEVLDYYLALESLRQYHREFLDLDDRELKENSFLVYYSSFLVQYRFALELIDLLEKHSFADKILNEPVPELGLPEGQYASFKFRFLHVRIATEFAALEIAARAVGQGAGYPSLRRSISRDRGVIWDMGRGKGEILTLKNALTILKDTGFKAWLPVQRSVAQGMGNIRVWRPEQFFITRDQIRDLSSVIRPGDILLQRREWFMSNIGLPGFWTHAALYVGTSDERRAFFNEEETRAWVRSMSPGGGDLEALLQNRSPDAYRNSMKRDEKGHLPRVLEAIAKGVVFTTLEHSAAADSLAVLRPRLSRREIAEALQRAFRYSGRPYDYNFDFATDDKLVCSELVYKAYEPSQEYRGVTFPLVEMMGRLVTPPNVIARLFDDEFDSDHRQLAFVFFLDGHEKERKAVKASVDDFRQSWKRPKWHILTQADLGE